MWAPDGAVHRAFKSDSRTEGMARSRRSLLRVEFRPGQQVFVKLRKGAWVRAAITIAGTALGDAYYSVTLDAPDDGIVLLRNVARHPGHR